VGVCALDHTTTRATSRQHNNTNNTLNEHGRASVQLDPARVLWPPPPRTTPASLPAQGRVYAINPRCVKTIQELHLRGFFLFFLPSSLHSFSVLLSLLSIYIYNTSLSLSLSFLSPSTLSLFLSESKDTSQNKTQGAAVREATGRQRTRSTAPPVDFICKLSCTAQGSLSSFRTQEKFPNVK